MANKTVDSDAAFKTYVEGLPAYASGTVYMNDDSKYWTFNKQASGKVNAMCINGDDIEVWVYDGTDWITNKIPEVIDNLTSTSTIDALSANQGRVLDEKTAKSSYVSSMSQLKSIMNLSSGIPIVLGLSGTVLDTLAGNSRGSFGFGIAVKADASTMDLMYARLGSNVIGILRYNLSTDTISKSKEYVWS